MSDNTNTRHRGNGGVEDLLPEGHEAMTNRDAGKSEESNFIQYTLATLKEIRPRPRQQALISASVLVVLSLMKMHISSLSSSLTK